ncbi:DeoR family transcriptional regulator [Deferribacter autotrophicus]|uniref:DeoR family transcriptional regulator n=2 Tax=Deferribacter autotrophicus TaxID=500465 RepID=A0A5A8F4U2_9BACT|nr:DeoR family transcriptional regulator [Deferribacter autotrophicus]
MEWSDPGFAFRVTFKKVNYEKTEKEKNIANDYDRLNRQQTGNKPATKRQQTGSELKLISMGLNNRQIKAIVYVQEHGRITNKEYRQIFNVSERTARNDLKELCEKEIFQKIGETGRSTYYILKEKDSDR